MLQVQPDGKLLITPEAGTSLLTLKHKLVAGMGLLAVLCVVAYVYAGLVAAGAVLVLLAVLAAKPFITLRKSEKVLSGGQFLVGCNTLAHLAGEQKDYRFNAAQCHMQVVVLEGGGFGLIIKPKHKKGMLCTGLSEQEALAMKACLEGRQIGKRNAKIRLQSG